MGVLPGPHVAFLARDDRACFMLGGIENHAHRVFHAGCCLGMVFTGLLHGAYVHVRFWQMPFGLFYPITAQQLLPAVRDR